MPARSNGWKQEEVDIRRWRGTCRAGQWVRTVHSLGLVMEPGVVPGVQNIQYGTMNKTRILFGVTLALLLAVGVGLYVENNRVEAVKPVELVDEQVVEPKVEAAAPSDEVAEKLAEMEAMMERQKLAYERDMLRMREDLAKTEVERDSERVERERIELQLKQRVAQIRSASKLTTIVEAFPDQGFVVIGAGESKNVSVGQRFRVRRNDKVVGQVEITSVDYDNSVADPVPGTLVREEGDASWLLVGDDIIALE